MMSILLRTLVIVGAICMAPAAGAVSASATASNFRFSLADLYPDDGIAPSVQFMQTGYAYQAIVASDYRSLPYVHQVASDYGPGLLTFNDRVLATGWGGDGVVGGNMGVNNGFPTANIVAAGSTNLDMRQFELRSVARWDFILGIGTQMTVQADAQADTSAPNVCFGGECTRALSRITLQFGGYEGDGLMAAANLPGVSYPVADARTLSVSHANDSTTGGLYASLDVRMYSFGRQVGPIPEPTTWTLMMLGIGALVARAGWPGRRKAR